MELTTFLMACMGSTYAIESGVGPSDAPSSVRVTLYAGVKRRVSWTIEDATATSRIYRDNSGAWVYLGQVAIGVDSYDTGLTTGDTFGVSHYKNGQESAITEGSLS